MVDMIHYLSLQLRGPVQESSPPPGDDDWPAVLPAKHTVFGVVRFHLLYYVS